MLAIPSGSQNVAAVRSSEKQFYKVLTQLLQIILS